MNWSDYVPLLIVFVVVFRSVTKATREKKRDTMKTDVPHYKSEKEMYSPDTSTKKRTAKNKSTMQAKATRAVEPKTFSTIDDTVCMEVESLNNDFFPIKNIDEIRRMIVYAEIFKKGFYDN
ncbi:MAG: hypothetical protein Pg6B_05540 [Candidatus Azobacteroides pseudotrichonymphae]|jgi:hypothetical protein|nr:hypothetical protein [Bacteroidales bacterium OttesenSCG-928-I14]GMO35117.1 MAG: hypothetical protein Pg6B_05540 [Candidatus Azobacteroides pseudotrichonymphae]